MYNAGLCSHVIHPLMEHSKMAQILDYQILSIGKYKRSHSLPKLKQNTCVRHSGYCFNTGHMLVKLN